MDPGLQVYQGQVFREKRDNGDRIFLSLPPPKKSVGRGRGASYASTASTRSTSPAGGGGMANYYAGAGGGCFGGNSTVFV